MDTMAIIWGALIVIFLVVEGVTAGLASIWFAAGALAALATQLLGGELWLQIVIFAVVSAASLALTRPLVRKYVNSKVQPTNADMVIGREAIVTQRIDNVMGTGSATVGGREWTARSSDGSVLEEGTLAVVKTIEGVKLIVEPLEMDQEKYRDQKKAF